MAKPFVGQPRLDLLGQQLAEAGTHQGRGERLFGCRVVSHHQHERHPRLQPARADQDQGLVERPHGAPHPVRAPDAGHLEDLDAQRGVRAHEPFDGVDAGVGVPQVLGDAQDGEARALQAVSPTLDDLGPREEVALEVFEAQRLAVLELRLVLDLLGQQRHAVASAALEQFGNLVRLDQREVDLDDGGHFEDALGTVEPREVVHGEREALVEEPLAPLDHLVVDDDRLEHFDHRALRRQHDRDVADQCPPAGVAEDQAVAGQAVDPDLDRVEEDLGRHEVALEVVLGLACREGVFGRPEEELVADRRRTVR